MANPTPTYVMRNNSQPVVLGSTLLTPIGRVPFAGTVVGVRVIGNALLTGVTTNTRTFSLYNKLATGVGTVLIAQRAFITGVNMAIMVDTPVALSATPANLQVAQGDCLQWESLFGGTGIADPGCSIEVEIQPYVGVGGN